MRMCMYKLEKGLIVNFKMFIFFFCSFLLYTHGVVSITPNLSRMASTKRRVPLSAHNNMYVYTYTLIPIIQ